MVTRMSVNVMRTYSYMYVAPVDDCGAAGKRELWANLKNKKRKLSFPSFHSPEIFPLFLSLDGRNN